MHQKIFSIGMRQELLMLVSSSNLEMYRSLFWGKGVFSVLELLLIADSTSKNP